MHVGSGQSSAQKSGNPASKNRNSYTGATSMMNFMKTSSSTNVAQKSNKPYLF